MGGLAVSGIISGDLRSKASHGQETGENKEVQPQVRLRSLPRVFLRGST